MSRPSQSTTADDVGKGNTVMPGAQDVDDVEASSAAAVQDYDVETVEKVYRYDLLSNQDNHELELTSFAAR